MENFGIILSIPAAFINSIFYAFVLRKVTTKLPFLILPLLWISTFVLVASFLEFCCLLAFGTLKLRKTIGEGYYSIHKGLFFLTLPALVNIMRLQNRFSFLSKWYSIGCFCAVVGLCMMIQQYVVSEALFGLDGMDGPYGNP
jgi:hypothetical protein